MYIRRKTKQKATKITPDMIVKVLRRNATDVKCESSRLWFDVLAKAVNDSESKTYKEECAYFFTSRHFDNVCAFVGLDPVYARELIAKLGNDLPVLDTGN